MILIFIRSLIFSIAFHIHFAGMLIIMNLTSLLEKNKEKPKFFYLSKRLNRNSVLLLKYICGVNFKVIGIENLRDEPLLILFKHESEWETYFLYQYFEQHPSMMCKQELTNIPLFGNVLINSDCIIIDRKGGITTIKKIVSKAKEAVRNNRHVVMAPQGTRVPLNSSTKDFPYKKGFISIVEACNLSILPVALNSGKCWSKNDFLKYPGIIEVRFLPIIERKITEKMNSNEIVSLVENIIENERNKMV